MRIVDLPIDFVIPAPWNPNEMDPAIRERLRRSIERFGMVVPLVVRPLSDGRYETVNGAQRLEVLREKGRTSLTCVAVDVDDVQARLLSQALNHIAGEDNPGMRASLLRQVLQAVGEDEVAGLLPESMSASGNSAAWAKRSWRTLSGSSIGSSPSASGTSSSN